MTLIGANALKELKAEHLRVLVAIEVGMIHSEYVPIEEISKISGFSLIKSETLLKKCHKFDLIHRWTGHYVGYELTIHGYDTLALNALYEKGIITSLGKEKGVGKEAKVYYALTPKNTEIVLKLHRVGFTSFHQVNKKRRYTANKKHISALYASRLSAESEIKWIKLANKIELPVPIYFGSNRHVIALELIRGIDLVKLKSLTDPQVILEETLEFIEKSWKEGNFVHGDLSEHNIIINYNEKPIFIDFPQSVESFAPNADHLLKRDIKNILTYFNRKYGLFVDEQIVYEQITDLSVK